MQMALTAPCGLFTRTLLSVLRAQHFVMLAVQKGIVLFVIAKASMQHQMPKAGMSSETTAVCSQATQSLVSALKCNTTLKELELSSNGLGEEGGRILAEAIEVNT